MGSIGTCRPEKLNKRRGRGRERRRRREAAASQVVDVTRRREHLGKEAAYSFVHWKERIENELLMDTLRLYID